MTLRRITTVGLLTAALMALALVSAQAGAPSALATVVLGTNQSEFSPGTQNMGWWDDAGTHSIGNDNYEVGNAPDLGSQILRNFFTFDGSLVSSGCAKNARLVIPIGQGSGDFGGVTTGARYVLNDVLTSAVTLNTTAGPSAAIYNDLGSGTIYASNFLPTVGPYSSSRFTIQLNAAAVAALNVAIDHGGFFSIGGAILHEPDDTSLFGFTPVEDTHGNDLPVQLRVEVGTC